MGQIVPQIPGLIVSNLSLVSLVLFHVLVLVVVFRREGVESEPGHVGEEEEHGVRLEEPQALPHHFGGALGSQDVVAPPVGRTLLLPLELRVELGVDSIEQFWLEKPLGLIFPMYTMKKIKSG